MSIFSAAMAAPPNIKTNTRNATRIHEYIQDLLEKQMFFLHKRDSDLLSRKDPVVVKGP
jgi:hypothetical protein